MDYNELTNEQLNTEIAKRLGYTIRKQHIVVPHDLTQLTDYAPMETITKAGEYDVYVLYAPDGSEVNEIAGMLDEYYPCELTLTEASAWGELPYNCNWAGKADYALKLIEPDGFTIDYYADRGYEVQLDYGLARVGVDKEFCRAVCIAWLMWQTIKSTP